MHARFHIGFGGRRSGDTILSTVKSVLRLSPAHPRLLPLLVALGLAASLAESVGVSLVVLFLYSALGRASEAGAASGFLGGGFTIIAAEVGTGPGLAALIFGVIAANLVLTFAYALITARIRYRLSEALRNRLNKQFLEVSYDFILRHEQGHLMNVWSGESWSLGEMYLAICRILISGAAAVVFTLFMLAISWKLLVIAGPGIILILAGMQYLSAPARMLGRRMKKEHENLAARMLVTLQGMRAVRAFGREPHFEQVFETASAEVRKASMAFERLAALVPPAVQIGYLLLLVGIVLIGGPLGVSFAATLAFVALLYRLQPHMRELESNLLCVVQLEASARSVIGMLDRADKAYVTSGEVPFRGLRREIRFEAVSFTYAGALSPSLDKASFAVPAGSVTALVGVSGAGKTTIVNLLLQLYRPDAGLISVDGVRLERLDRPAWLARLGVAGQDVELIEGTVRDNLRLAAPQADIAAIRSAAETAGILDTIEGLPHGFDSWIGRHGLKLSGGQRQRLGLARALLRDPDILILDEATNALDSGLEHQIWRALRQKLAGRTFLVITHRPETVMSADRVICLGSGRVLEAGTPAELRSRPDSVLWALLREGSDPTAPAGE